MDFNVIDKILEEQGLNYEDLNAQERETYTKANFSLQKLTVADVKDYVGNMKASIALQLAKTPESETNTNILLKARLMNYVVLEAFLVRPDKAEEALRKQFAGKDK